MAALMKNALRFIQPKSKRKGVSLADIKRGEKTLGAFFFTTSTKRFSL